MGVWLKQSTAVVISFGPFLLNTDGVTLVTNLVGTGANQTENTSTGIRIAKNGGAFAARHAAAAASSYDAFGNYLVTLDTTDTGTLGVLRVQFVDAAHFCPVWQDFLVIAANVYDSLIGGGDLLDVSVAQFIGTAPTEGGAGRLAAGFTKQYDVVSPVFTAASVNQTGDAYNVVKSGGAGDAAVIKTQTDKLTFTVTNQVDSNPKSWAGTTIPSPNVAGVPLVDWKYVLGTILTEGGAGRLAAAIIKFFDVATPVLTAASVNQTKDVLAALATDTYAEPGQGTPAATTTLAVKIGYVYKFLRNRIEQDQTTLKVYNDGGTVVDQKATVSDDGTTYTRGPIVTGP